MIDTPLDLQKEIKAAIAALSLLETEKENEQLIQEMSDPDFWSSQEYAARVSKKQARLQKKIDTWRGIEKQINDLVDMSALEDDSLQNELDTEFSTLRAQFEKLQFSLMLSGPYDENDAVISIHSGTGGTDAMDWAEMLERMYLRFFESQGWRATIVDRSTGEEAGIKHSIIEVEGDYAFGKLQSEHGVHRLVRLSPFNADSLRQTSFALVEVVPTLDEQEVTIDESELKIDVYRAGGRGGQSVNTTDSAVRITHIPTGITVAIQNERSQLQNKQTAMKILTAKLIQLQSEQHAEKISDLKGPDVQAAWGNQIRNYVLHPYTLVKDTRTKHETNDAQTVLNGDIEPFINAYLKQTIQT